jgi:hypothetical protein
VRQRRETLASCGNRLVPAFERAMRDHRRELEKGREKLFECTRRIKVAWHAQSDRRTERLDAVERLRLTLGYEQTLKRGYAVVRGDGEVVTTAEAAGQAAALEIQFQDGRLAVGAGVRTGPKPKSPPPVPTSPNRDPCSEPVSDPDLRSRALQRLPAFARLVQRAPRRIVLEAGDQPADPSKKLQHWCSSKSS